MPVELQEMISAAAEMNTTDRAALATYLLDSFDDEDATDDDWTAIAKERMEEVKSGKVIGIPAEEVLRTLLDPKA